jgi:two-component system, OmpR family, response regulator
VSARILVVEDDPRIASFLRRGLAAEGHAVELVADGRSALDLAAPGGFDLLVVDRMLPGIEGLELCRRLRAAGCTSRVLMLTARDRPQDKVDGLRGGADDYLTKPFSFDELLARVEALLRRQATLPERRELEIGDLRVDLDARAASRAGRRLDLTPREFKLLACLAEHAGTVLSRERLLGLVWGRNFDTGNKLVDVYVRYLRRKLDEGEQRPMLRTVRGFGYLLDRPDADP